MEPRKEPSQGLLFPGLGSVLPGLFSQPECQHPAAQHVWRQADDYWKVISLFGPAFCVHCGCVAARFPHAPRGAGHCPRKNSVCYDVCEIGVMHRAYRGTDNVNGCMSLPPSRVLRRQRLGYPSSTLLTQIPQLFLLTSRALVASDARTRVYV